MTTDHGLQTTDHTDDTDMRSGRINSRRKGARAERLWRDELRANGYSARRGQQFAGSPDSPDVVCEELDWIHFEVKAVERLNIWDAMDQARRDAGKSEVGGQRSVISDQSSVGKVPIVTHTRNFRPWLITMTAETFFRLLRGDFPQQPQLDSLAPARSALPGPSPSANSFRRFPSGSSLRGSEEKSISAGDECPGPSVEQQQS